jgi:hypothetical protein
MAGGAGLTNKVWVALDKVESFVKRKNSGRCVSTAPFASLVEDQSLTNIRCIILRRAFCAPHQPSIRLSTTGHDASIRTSSQFLDASALIQSHDLAAA